MVRLVLAAAVLALALSGGAAWAHEPGPPLDVYGCHEEPAREEYHCHRAPRVGKVFSSKEEMLESETFRGVRSVPPAEPALKTPECPCESSGPAAEAVKSGDPSRNGKS